MERKPVLVVITGPTASGKTALALAVASRFGTEIVSADSRQVYRELKTGTARPAPEELARVRHHLIGHLSIHDAYNASLFETEVLALLGRLFAQFPVVIMAGGSMLYIDAVCHGIDDLPSVDGELREHLIARLQREGLESLRFDLKRLDPDYYGQADLQNPKRILHALEMCLQTGKPYSALLRKERKSRSFAVIKAGLNPDRKTLYDRINLRVDAMVAGGLEEEARGLLAWRSLNALNTVGYREWFPYFDGEISREEAIRQIKSNTRRYARKQMTWYRRDPDIQWFSGSDTGAIVAWLEEEIRSKGEGG